MCGFLRSPRSLTSTRQRPAVFGFWGRVRERFRQKQIARYDRGRRGRTDRSNRRVEPARRYGPSWGPSGGRDSGCALAFSQKVVRRLPPERAPGTAHLRTPPPPLPPPSHRRASAVPQAVFDSAHGIRQRRGRERAVRATGRAGGAPSGPMTWGTAVQLWLEPSSFSSSFISLPRSPICWNSSIRSAVWPAGGAFTEALAP